jgi:hypothetical protein
MVQPTGIVGLSELAIEPRQLGLPSSTGLVQTSSQVFFRIG